MERVFNFILLTVLIAIFAVLFKMFFNKQNHKYSLSVFSVLVLMLCIDYMDILPEKLSVIYLFLFISFIFAALIFLKKEFIYDGLNYEKSLMLLIKLFFIYYLLLIFKTAWISDDAYITFRVADNFVNGYGLRWNVEERVQVFTNTLFLFIFIPLYFIFRDAYFVALFLNFLFSILTILLLKKILDSKEKFLLTIAGLCFSKAYIDFSTSGLENSMTFFLLSLFLYVCFKYNNPDRKWIYISLIFSGVFLNRPDSILIILPVILLMAYKEKPPFKYVVYGLIPLFVWEIFSIIYYGFPFPNTFYAKLMTGINKYELVKQGGYYFLNSILSDPATLSIILCSTVISFFSLFKSKKILINTLIIGILAYLIYILFSGGDFMSGRFFACLLPVSLFAVVNMVNSNKNLFAFLFSVIFLSLISPYFSIPDFKVDNKEIIKISNQIISEREFYYNTTGLINVLTKGKRNIDESGYAKDAKRIKDDRGQQRKTGISIAIGMFGFYAGPEVYIIDQVTIADAFTARLPAAKRWRIGHFAREWPEGYEETLRQGKNLIKDKKLSEFYDKISIITKGKIFSKGRFKTIIEVNLNKGVSFGTR